MIIMTAIIVEAPKALPTDHVLRRLKGRVPHDECFSGSGDNRTKTAGTTRYFGFNRQDEARAYWNDRQAIKRANAADRTAAAFVMPSLSDLPSADNPPAILRSHCEGAIRRLHERLEILDARPGCVRKERTKINARIAEFEAELAKHPVSDQPKTKRKAKKK
jgi:hypothetical protein